MDDDVKLFEDLKMSLSSYMHKDEDLNLIEKAYLFAKEKHQNQFRKSGEPYINHPLNVAIILSTLHVGPNTICAGILHDTVEDTETSLDEISELFGSDIAGIVDGVTKVTELNFVSLEKTQAENHQKMIIAMAKDIRVIVVKLADRLHNMRTLEFQPKHKQIRISNETIEIYSPLAHKLGMFTIKAELEDIALKYINPSMYETISSLIEHKLSSEDNYIDKMINLIQGSLDKNNITDYQIKGRIKSKYSIYKKMVSQDKAFEDIYDILAIRIIVPKVETCYHVLGIIHANFTPVPKRFKDYISVPKPNMYQSLHTTVIGIEGDTFEIQIRTYEMDETAEYGIAAHWAYKENVTYSKEKEQYEIAQKLKWYSDLLSITNEEEDAEDAENLVSAVKGDILDANVYVYTPKGEVIALPVGSTPLDFAYKIHTDIGNKTIGAIVNNKIVPLSYELKTGDIVSVRTNKNSLGPNEDWLKLVKTSHAKQKIKNFLNKQNYELLVLSGKNDLERELSLNKSDATITNEFVKTNFAKYGLNTVEDLYLEIGKGLIAARTVVMKLLDLNPFDFDTTLNKQMEKSKRILTTNSETGVVVPGLSNPQIKLAACCYPIPGDKILGLVSKGNGIIVHRGDCNNLSTFDKNRLLLLDWATTITRKYPTIIKIQAMNRNNLVADIINQLNSYNMNVLSFSANNTKDLTVNIKIKLLTTNKYELENLTINLHKVDGVINVKRG